MWQKVFVAAPFGKYEHFLKLSIKQFVIQSSLISLAQITMYEKAKINVVSSNGIFVSNKNYAGPRGIQFCLKGNSQSKSVSEWVVQVVSS